MAASTTDLLSAKKPKFDKEDEQSNLHFVAPGDVITTDTDFMRGHGTYAVNGELLASVAGVVQRVNKLIYVQPLKSRYNGEVGDVLVGRIIEVQQKRWKVATYSRLDSVLLLSSINLPGGILRRRGVQDELMMREYFKEGDLISAEVQQVYHDGSLSLHTRSLKYGKLSQGTLVMIPPSLVKRCKNHFHNLLCGASIILGNNGYIWISTRVSDDHQQPQMRFQTLSEELSLNVADKMEPIKKGDREVIARLRNCILALAQQRIMLFDTTVQYTYDASLKYQVKVLLDPDVVKEITEPAQNVAAN